MVLRFKIAPGEESVLRDIVDKARTCISSIGPFEEGGVVVTAAYIDSRFRLMDNLDLYVADDLPDEVSGQMLKVLRTKDFLGEDAQVVVPPHRVT